MTGQVSAARVKHLEVKYLHVKKLVTSNQIELVYVKTSEQLADLLTKPLSNSVLEEQKKCLQVG